MIRICCGAADILCDRFQLQPTARNYNIKLSINARNETYIVYLTSMMKLQKQKT